MSPSSGEVSFTTIVSIATTTTASTTTPRRAASLSVSDGALNLRDFHVVAPGALATRDRIGIWRASVAVEPLPEAYELHGDWECLPGPSFSFSSSIAIQKSTRPDCAPQIPSNSF
ncbi:hypothetical protein BKA70DRAFT_1566740 [Coprinopsis sp. MPI-PUGE-AT-0042]|nr:hypothetical protein BKA70DRAFT_1566740 [Coprinopsis sp. MPI-PUGE-AT-0042]